MTRYLTSKKTITIVKFVLKGTSPVKSFTFDKIKRISGL